MPRKRDPIAAAIHTQRVQKRDKRLAKAIRRAQAAPRLRVLADMSACWCGQPCGHDWPGRADGAPHPRDEPPRVTGTCRHRWIAVKTDVVVATLTGRWDETVCLYCGRSPS